MFINTGDYIKHTNDDIFQSTYYTFTPRPLLGGSFYTLDDDLVSSLTAAHRSIGILEGILLSFPDGELFSELILLKESCFNRMIDYPDIDPRTALVSRGLGKANDEINNIMSAYQHVLEPDARNISVSDIMRHALYGSTSNQKINHRSKQIFLENSVSNYQQYNPTAPVDIHAAMNDIGKYIELDRADILIKAAMCHYQFEIIHPYERYNGIVGRILAYKMLRDAGMNGICYLSLSEKLNNCKPVYFDKLSQTQKHGSYSAWVAFFVHLIGDATRSSIELAKSYKDIIQRDNDMLTCHDRKRQMFLVYHHYKKNIVSSVKWASEQLQLSFNAVSRAITELQSLGILTQITLQSRNRLFAHTDLLRLISPEQG